MRVCFEWFASSRVLVLPAACVACAGQSSLPVPDDVGGSSAGPNLGSPSSNGENTATTAEATHAHTTTSGSSSPSKSETTNPTPSAAVSAREIDNSTTDDTPGSTHASTTDSTQTSGVVTGTAGAVEALSEYLQRPRAERGAIEEQSFADVPLSKVQAVEAQRLLWQDHKSYVEAERLAEHEAKAITLEGKTLKYDFTVFGEPKANGRSLVLSLHGGGEAEASVNDGQWENQKGLYTLDEGIYLAPRAPTNTWNLWHEAHIDVLFTRLIENFIALEGVDPNRVYVMGYSAGGDGVYQLGPRMADHWAAAASMAGHPNEAKPFSLRNVGFTIHVGGDDTAFDRNLVAGQWRNDLDALQADDPEGYEHVVEVHEGKGHWMDLEDAVAVPWMAEFTRDPVPNRIVWYQDDILHQRFYWLRVVSPTKETTVVAQLNGQTVTLDSADVAQVGVRLRDDMLDLDQAVTIQANGTAVFEGVLPRTINTLYTSLVERGDPTFTFTAETMVVL